MTDWGFANHDGYEKNQESSSKALPSIAARSIASTASATDQEYSDDDFEIENGSPTMGSGHVNKKKKRRKNKSLDSNDTESPLLVPISKKSNLPPTSRPMSSSQSYSLPAI